MLKPLALLEVSTASTSGTVTCSRRKRAAALHTDDDDGIGAPMNMRTVPDGAPHPQSAPQAAVPADDVEIARKRVQRRVMGIVFLTLFLDLLGFGVILPNQPFYAESFGASATQVTLIGAVYSLMQFVFAPLWGRLSDRIGRRPVVLISIAFACTGWLVLGFANALWMFLLSRAVAGFGNANLGTVQAIVADITRPDERAKGMGLVGAAFGMGFLFGPVLGGYFGAAFGPAVPAFIAAGLAALNWVLALALLPETRKPGVVVVGAHAPRRSLFPFDAMREAARIDGVLALLVMGFVFTFGFSLMESGLALFVERQFVDVDIAGTEAGLKMATRLATAVFFTVGVTAVIVQGGLIRPLQRRFGEKKLLLAGALFIMLGFVGVATLPFSSLAFAAMFPVTIVIAVGSGLFSPSSSSLLSRSVDEHRQGSVLGVGQATSALGRICGPGLSGLLLDQHRSLPFAAGALLLGIAALLTMRVKSPAVH